MHQCYRWQFSIIHLTSTPKLTPHCFLLLLLLLLLCSYSSRPGHKTFAFKDAELSNHLKTHTLVSFVHGCSHSTYICPVHIWSYSHIGIAQMQISSNIAQLIYRTNWYLIRLNPVNSIVVFNMKVREITHTVLYTANCRQLREYTIHWAIYNHWETNGVISAIRLTMLQRPECALAILYCIIQIHTW